METGGDEKTVFTLQNPSAGRAVRPVSFYRLVAVGTYPVGSNRDCGRRSAAQNGISQDGNQNQGDDPHEEHHAELLSLKGKHNIRI